MRKTKATPAQRQLAVEQWERHQNGLATHEGALQTAIAATGLNPYEVLRTWYLYASEQKGW